MESGSRVMTAGDSCRLSCSTIAKTAALAVLAICFLLAAAVSAEAQTPTSGPWVLSADATGGDCTVIGDWDFPSMTCTLASDLQGEIRIAGSGITLDGNGHTLAAGETLDTGNIGVFLMPDSDDNQITGLTITGFRSGIRMEAASGNLITGTTVRNSSIVGIDLERVWQYPPPPECPYPWIPCSSLSSNDNLVFNNNFIDNDVNAHTGLGAQGNLFSLALPAGGNYWSDYDTPGEGCLDGDGDGLCDSPYFTWGNANQDDFPYTKADGWAAVMSTEPSDLKQYFDDIFPVSGPIPAMIVKLENAQSSYDRGDVMVAVNQMGAFINHVESQSGKALTVEKADLLIGEANNVIDAMMSASGRS